MFVLLVACDLHGKKHNVEVGFPNVPTLGELLGHLESTLQIEARLLKPAGKRRAGFQLQHVQIFDEVLQRWVDLLSSTQLHDWAQLYVFQPDSLAQVDVQAQLPATRPIRSTPSGSQSEKLFQLFQDIDVNGNGYIERDELQRIFSVMGMFNFSEPEVDDYFVKADCNRDGVLSYAEFSKFSCSHAHAVDALFAASAAYFDAVRAKDNEKMQQQMRHDESRARYEYLAQRRDMLLMESELAAQRDALARAEAERVLVERHRDLALLKASFVDAYGADPASPAASPPRALSVASSASPVRAHGYSKSRRYPRPVSSPKQGSQAASPQRS